MQQVMLTTIDNPFDPFKNFEAWNEFDQRKGYNTNAFLARLAFTSEELSDQENYNAIEMAIDEIVENNVLGIYKKIIKKE